MKFKLISICLFVFLCHADAVFSQGFIIAKNKTQSVEVELLKYETKISVDNSIAQVEVKQVFFNPSTNSVQANYYFFFPAGGHVNGCTLELEGTAFSGELMDKSQSVQLCFDFIKDGLSPSFFSLMGRQYFQGNAYQIPAKGKRSITFKYSQILSEEGGLTRIDFPRYPVELQRRALKTTFGVGPKSYTMLASTVVSIEGLNDLKHELETFEKGIKISLRSDSFIKNIYSPNCSINVDRKSKRKVTVSVSNEDLHANDLVLYYAQDENDISAHVLSYRPDESSDGYFMLLASSLNPVPRRSILPKDVVFVLDVSGSMKGERFISAKDGLKRCIKSLHSSDYFNIITYSSEVKIYQKNLVRASEFSDDACEYVETLISGGGTNINEALLTALSIKPKYNKVKQIIFITDGLPTVGVTDIFTIQENISRLNLYDFQIHSFAIKSNVNVRLLQGLARLTNGRSEYVERLSELSDKLVRFFESVKSPVLGSIQFSVPDAELRDVFGNNSLNIYQDGKIIIVGRYKKPGQFDLFLSGKGNTGKKKLHCDINFDRISGDNVFIKHIWQKRKLGYSLENDKFFYESDYANIKKDMSVFLNGFDFNESKVAGSIGKKAIERVKILKSLKEADSLIKVCNAMTIVVNKKIFKLANDGYWEDAAFSSKSEDIDHVLHLKYGSKAYFDLAKDVSALRPFLALGSRLKLNYANYLIKIDKSGLEEINNFPF